MGTAYAVKYNGTLYYYITNLQGDILHIVDTSGVPVVSYTYSPYGKGLSTTGTLADTLGTDNPLRYRSYYYDTDSGLYYLQSRYYDPELGRFLNADAYASTGQGILGTNMFAYCNNNPAFFIDTGGTAPWPTTVAVNDGGCKEENNPFLWNDPSRPYYARIHKDEARNSARRILSGYAFVEYKGVMVFKIPLMEDSAFSCGCIFIGDDFQYDKFGIATLNHEYGHYVQLSQIGWVNYIAKIMIPSLKGFWFPIPDTDYYSQPWEYTADLFGEANRYWHTYSDDAHEKAMTYWEQILNG